MLESPEDEIVQKACESLFKFCEKSTHYFNSTRWWGYWINFFTNQGDNNKLIVHELGATAKLNELLNHEDRSIQRNATMAFGILSSCGRSTLDTKYLIDWILLNEQEFVC